MSKMGYIRIIRPSSCIMVSLISVIGQAFALGRTPELFTAIPAFLTGFFMTGSSFSINDYIDHEIDSINTPWRPIPSGLITRDEALRIGIVLGLSGSIISLFTTPPASIVAIGALLFSILYTLKGKYLGILGHIMVAISISSTFIFGALTIMQNITPFLFGLFVISFLFVLGGEVTQSIADIEGDKAKGKRSIAILNGCKVASIVATICFILTALAGATTSYFYGNGIGTYSIPIIIGTIIITSFITLPLLRNPNKDTAIKTRKRINYLAYLIIFVLLISSLVS